MITREVLELEVGALLTDSSLYCRELPLYHCCSERPAYFGVEATFSSCLLEYVEVCFGVLDDAKMGPVRVDG